LSTIHQERLQHRPTRLAIGKAEADQPRVDASRGG